MLVDVEALDGPMGNRRTLVLAVIAAALLIATAGCTTSATTATPTDTTTVTESAPPDPASSASTPSAAPPVSATPAVPASAAPVTECTTAHLAGSLGQTDGAAGTDTTPLRLTNRGPVACTVQGWPGVSAVGGGDGAQIGPAAILERATPHPTITLDPGASATATLTSTGKNAPTCDPVPSAGFRVYPPGQRASLFIPTRGGDACSVAQDLEVGAFR